MFPLNASQARLQVWLFSLPLSFFLSLSPSLLDIFWFYKLLISLCTDSEVESPLGPAGQI